MIGSYASPVALGHKSISDIFDGDNIIVQEKVDGSQISFGVVDGEVHARSRGAPLHIMAPDKMFARAIEEITSRADKLVPGWVYRGEYLKVPKHNVLAYERVPNGHIVLFDIETEPGQHYLPYKEVEKEAVRLGLSFAPVYHVGRVATVDSIRGLLSNISCLGGAKIEGVVVKNYDKFTSDHKVMMGKFVSEDFKEIHKQEWKSANPSASDCKDKLVLELRTPARWNKAIQHLREAGTLTSSVKDIGPLIKEVKTDIEKECTDYIKDKLFEHFWPEIQRGVVYGVPEWYKEYLLKESLNAPTDNTKTE